jgi:hypothetical protein
MASYLHVRQPVFTFGMYGRRLGFPALVVEDEADEEGEEGSLRAILAVLRYCFPLGVGVIPRSSESGDGRGDG